MYLQPNFASMDEQHHLRSVNHRIYCTAICLTDQIRNSWTEAYVNKIHQKIIIEFDSNCWFVDAEDKKVHLLQFWGI